MGRNLAKLYLEPKRFAANLGDVCRFMCNLEIEGEKMRLAVHFCMQELCPEIRDRSYESMMDPFESSSYAQSRLADGLLKYTSDLKLIESERY